MLSVTREAADFARVVVATEMMTECTAAAVVVSTPSAHAPVPAGGHRAEGTGAGGPQEGVRSAAGAGARETPHCRLLVTWPATAVAARARTPQKSSGRDG
jgi:hypothetical protein